MNGNKKYLDMLFGALIVIVLGVLIYFGYTFYNKTKLNNNPKTTTTLKVSTTTTQTVNESLGLETYPKANDNSVTDLGHLASVLTDAELQTNFTNLVKEKKGYKTTYNCADFSYNAEAGGNACNKVKIMVNNSEYETNLVGDCGPNTATLIYKDKVITYNTYECSGDGSIKIYQKNSLWFDSVSLIEKVTCSDNENSIAIYYENLEYFPKVLQNRLYFIAIRDASSVNDNLSYGYVDLSKDQSIFTEIKKYSGSFQAHC